MPDDNVVIAGAGASFEMTIFRDVHARSKHEITIDLPELAERIRAKEAVAKEDLPLGSFAKFGGKVSEKGSLRHDANVLSFSGIWVEHDAGTMGFDDAMMRIIEAGLAAVIYTTPRHTPERPRWRVGFPFAGPMTAAARGSNSDACPSPRGLGPLSWDRQRQWSRNELC